MRLFSVFTVAMMLAATLQTALACTGIRLTAGDGAVVVGRTLEFGVDLQSKVGVYPAGTSMTGTLPNGQTGFSYKTKYGMVGANAFGLPAIVDGLNDQGLYVGLFFFPGYAGYASVTAENRSRAMGGYEYGTWVLGNFATVAELKAAYDRVALVDTTVPQMGSAPPVHYRVVDKTGAAVVIEPIDGHLVIYDDPLAVLTNAPTFDWHLTNLNNYVGLTPANRPQLTVGGVALQSMSQGSGFYGLPGDFTSPSRFVRAAAFELSAVTPATAGDAVQQTFHLLNNFDIPVGAVRQVVSGKSIDEWTLWTSAADLKNKWFYFRTFQDQTLRGIGVQQALAAAGNAVTYLPMEGAAATPIAPVKP